MLCLKKTPINKQAWHLDENQKEKLRKIQPKTIWKQTVGPRVLDRNTLPPRFKTPGVFDSPLIKILSRIELTTSISEMGRGGTDRMKDCRNTFPCPQSQLFFKFY